MVHVPEPSGYCQPGPRHAACVATLAPWAMAVAAPVVKMAMMAVGVVVGLLVVVLGGGKVVGGEWVAGWTAGWPAWWPARFVGVLETVSA